MNHPVVSAVAVRTYLVDVVSFPEVGVAVICHFPATSASDIAGAGAGAGAGAAAVVSAGAAVLSPFAAPPLFLQPTTNKPAQQTTASCEMMHMRSTAFGKGARVRQPRHTLAVSGELSSQRLSLRPATGYARAMARVS